MRETKKWSFEEYEEFLKLTEEIKQKFEKYNEKEFINEINKLQQEAEKMLPES